MSETSKKLIVLDEQNRLPAEAIEYIDAVTRQYADIEREVKGIKAQLMQVMATYNVGKIETDNVVITMVTPKPGKPKVVFNEEKFKAAEPFLYEIYCEEQEPDARAPYIKITNR